MGVTALGLCSRELKPLVAKFSPGLSKAVLSGDFAAVCKLMKCWVSPFYSTLVGGKSVMDLTRSHTTGDVYTLKCLQKIRDTGNQMVGHLGSDDWCCCCINSLMS